MATETPTTAAAQVCAYVSNGSVYAYLAHDYAPAGEPLPDLVKYYRRTTGSTKLLLAPAVVSASYDQEQDNVHVTALGAWRDHPNVPQQPALVETWLQRDAKTGLGYLSMEVFAVDAGGRVGNVLFTMPPTRCAIVALAYAEQE